MKSRIRPVGMLSSNGGELFSSISISACVISRPSSEGANWRRLMISFEMRRALERVHSEHGQIVGVVGEAGFGKSRLFHQFKATLGGGFKMLETSGVAHAKGWV